MTIPQQFWRLYHRARRFSDVPAVLELLKFKGLRRRYYDQLWQEAAAEAGAIAEPPRSGFIKIRKGSVATFVRQDKVMLDSQLMLNLMGNKGITYDLLREKGCPIPLHLLFTIETLGKAEAFRQKLGSPVVVKPVSGTGGGNGVTTGINDADGLKRAAKHAAKFGSDILIEEELTGHSYRLIYLDGVLLHAVRRDPPVVTGDGRSSIKALATAETQRRLKGSPFTALSPLRIDAEAINTLKAQGLTPSSVPAAGQTVTVKKAINQNSMAQNHTVTAEVHPETAAACARLVKDLGVQFAGIDIISKDIGVPLTANGGVIGEINTTPGIHHHYLVAEARRGPGVAAQLLEFMFRTGTGSMRLNASFPAPEERLPDHAA
jgi:cyanophycin synthetase